MKKRNITTNELFESNLQKVKEINPDFDMGQLIRMSVKYIADNEIEFGFASPAPKKKAERIQEKTLIDKESWCEMYGGEVKNGVCDIVKYEVMPSGHVMKSDRSIAISAFPDNESDFKRSIISTFETLIDAEAAYQAKPLSL